jgi:hypothetical protein
MLWCWMDIQRRGCCVVTVCSYYTSLIHRGFIADSSPPGRAYGGRGVRVFPSSRAAPSPTVAPGCPPLFFRHPEDYRQNLHQDRSEAVS